MSSHEYIGRFAPSPTGKLHMGSLMTAVASYCDAMSHNGQWLVRIEDIDPPREVAGASNDIIKTLTDYGFKFNSNVIFQSDVKRQNAYEEALNALIQLNVVYFCSCSRKDLAATTIENHHCRNNSSIPEEPYSIKIKVPDSEFSFLDKIQGQYTRNLKLDCGDFVIKRKEQLFSYQIAVVVDDNEQGVTNIVRGIDLIDSTPWQMYLISLLNYKQVDYAHIPILVNSEGQKLSKQTFAEEITTYDKLNTLLTAYFYLNQPPFEIKPKSLSEFWNHAISNWNINKISKVESIKV